MSGIAKDAIDVEMDDTALEGIGGTGGVVPLLEAVFSYLARKTDLFSRAGGGAAAEKLILHTSRQAYEKVQAEKDKVRGSGGDGENGGGGGARATAVGADIDCFTDTAEAARVVAAAASAPKQIATVEKAAAPPAPSLTKPKAATSEAAVAAREEAEVTRRAAKAEKAKVTKKEKAKRAKARKREQREEAELLAREDTVYELDDDGNLVLGADTDYEAKQQQRQQQAAAAAKHGGSSSGAKKGATDGTLDDGESSDDEAVGAAAAASVACGDRGLEDALRTVRKGATPLATLPALEQAAQRAAERQCCALFYHFDQDRDGVLCYDELAALQRLKPQPVAHAAAWRLPGARSRREKRLAGGGYALPLRTNHPVRSSASSCSAVGARASMRSAPAGTLEAPCATHAGHTYASQ